MKITEKKLRLVSVLSVGVSLLACIISYFAGKIPPEISYIYRNNEIVAQSWRDNFELFLAVVFLFTVLAAFVTTVIFIAQKIKSKWKISGNILRTCGCVILCYVIFGFSFSMVTTDDLYDYYPECYEFTDGQHTIVIEEESFLLYGGGTIYQIDDNNNAFVVGHISTDDGGRNHGNYDIEWSDNGCEITYDFCNLEHSKQTEKVKFR
ncbi:MAG: hypothetical protein K2J40_06355 [Ruminococcus sp.]|nr:hypothetical protein [Ruminococcus sp.]